MKDAKGHGSEKRGGGEPRQHPDSSISAHAVHADITDNAHPWPRFDNRGTRSAEPGRRLSNPRDENAYSLREIANQFYKDNSGKGWGAKAYRSGPLEPAHGHSGASLWHPF